jgi:subtilisin-like proprotein convertase family protein
VITDLNISLHIQHPWVGDLRIQLRNGAASWLIDRPGAPPGLGCSGDDIQCTLDDEAPLPVENQCVTPGPVAISGTFSPEQPLNRFDGQTLAGAWELRVFDSNANNAGNLVNWCLRPTLQ